MKRHVIKLVALAGLMISPFAAVQANTAPNYTQVENHLLQQTNLSKPAIEMAFDGYRWALKTKKVENPGILTIVDFTISSAKDRLYVVNLNTGQILMGLAVAHGKNSGQNSPWTTRFSNKDSSLQSSLGVYLTKSTYSGKHGFSLRIAGLEPSNSNAMARSVVVHAANYVTPEFIKKFGRAGTSWGCFAVNPAKSKQLIEYIKGGSVIYAYGNSKQYLASTKILSGQNSA